MKLQVTPYNRFSDRCLRVVQVPRRVVAALLCSVVLLAGCTKDLNNLDIPELPDPPQTESGSLALSISIPGITSAAPGSYALTPESEGFVDANQFNVLLFSAEDTKATDDAYLFERYVPATELNTEAGDVNSQGHYVKYFRINLPQNDNTKDRVYKVMVVANHVPDIEGETTEEKWKNLLDGLSLEAARKRITFEQADGSVWNTGNTPTPLPLWGETSSPFTAQMLRVATIPMLRAVARIDVGVNLGGAQNVNGNPTGAYDLSSPDYDGKTTDRDGQLFTLESVTLYNAARTGYIAPDPGNLSPDGRTPVMPTCDNVLYHGDQRPRYTTADNGGATNMLRRQIYLPETPNKVDEDDQAFFIVVGGRYGNGNTTYYRIDFYDRAANPEGTGTEYEDYVKPTAANRYDILRNHAYVINILRVRGEGYPTPEMAASAEPINMEVDIRSWDTGGNMGNITTDGQYYLSLSATQLRYHQDGTAQDLEVMTDFLLENDPEASGWRLLMLKEQIAGENSYNHADDVRISVETADGWVEATKTEYSGDTDYWLWTTGAANVTGRVRVGMNRFDENNQSQLMERTVTLLFTAGRMSQTVELVQDVKNTRTLSLLQQKLFFPKYPLRNQSALLKSSPSGATYYLVWTKVNELGETQVYRANLSEPEADDAALVTGREGYIGGISKATQDQLPTGFDCYLKHEGDASCTATEFFVKGSENMFALRPSAWDAKHTVGGTDEPLQPRTWRFEIEAYWDEEGKLDTNPERVKLDVEQSNYEVRWYPAQDEGTKETPLVDNTYTVPWDATVATPYIMTNPTDLSWYFVSKSDEGNLSGREWVTNWASELQGEPCEGEGTVNVDLMPNDNLLPRTVTFQASSAADGFDKTSSILKIRQEGGPFILTLLPGIGVAELPYNDATKTYTLDFGMSADRVMRTLNVRANTDWWWEWRKDDVNGEELGERTVNTSAYLEQYPTPIHIHNEHPYWKNETLPEKDNPGYIINEWLPEPSVSTAPGIENGSTGNSSANSTSRLWENALYMRSVTGVFLSPLAVSDESITQNRTIPVAGTYFSEIQLYNKHDSFPTDEEHDPDGVNQAKVDEASKILRVQRTVPSLLYLPSLPFNGSNDVNLSNFTTDELGTTSDDQRLWNHQRLTIRSNNKVTITLYDCEGMDETQLNKCGEMVYKPTKYEQVVDITLAELKRDDGEEFIIAADVPYNDTKKPHTYRIKIEGWRQSTKNGPDEAFTQELTYYSGYWISHPYTEQVARGEKLSCAGFDLLLDFSSSVYHKDQRIRIGRQKVSVGTYSDGSGYSQVTTPQGDPEYTEYKLDGSLYQCYVRYTVPENTDPGWMYIYWVEYKGKTTQEWSTIWSGGVEGTKPEIGKYLFLQEAKSYNGLVTLQNGPVVPQAPNWRMSPSNYDRNFINGWNNYEDNPASIRYNPKVVPNYAEYCASFFCGVTGEEFAITSDQNNRAKSLGFNTQATIDAYKKCWNKTGHIFMKTRTWLEGKHWMVGSRLHTRNAWDETEDISVYNVPCPDNHGIERTTMQQFTACEVYYRTSQSDSERGPLQLIVVRRAETGTAGQLPPYIASLQGSQVQQ